MKGPDVDVGFVDFEQYPLDVVARRPLWVVRLELGEVADPPAVVADPRPLVKRPRQLSADQPGRARYAFVSVTGKVLDSGALRCRG